MQMIKYLWVIPIIFLSNCGSAESKLSPMQKRQITSRVYDSDYETVYKATLTVLQDQGYIIKNTDMDSGLIVSEIDRETSQGAQFLQAIFSEVVDKGTLIEVSCMVGKISDSSTELRINIQETKYGAAGKQSANRLYDEKTYQQLFNEIRVEIKRIEAIRGE